MTALAWGLTVIAAVALAARWLPLSSTPAIAVAVAGPYVAVLLPISAICFVLRRDALGAVSACVILVASVAVRLPLFVGSGSAPSERDLRVVTANLELGRADAESVVDLVRSGGADVVMLQELTPDERGRLAAAGLDTLLPYSVVAARPGAAGTGLWSRWPLTSSSVSDRYTFAFISARVQPDGMPLFTALACHMAGPVPRADAWNRDIARLRADLPALGGGTAVLGGDLNATPDQLQFRRLLTDGWADAADQAGAGYTRTYPADRWFPPLLAIDHVLTRGAVATSARTAQIAGSDHRALAVTVRLPS